MKTKLILLIALLCCIRINAQAKYTLDDAIAEALKNNANVKMALLDVTKASAAVSEAFGYALPSVDVSTTFSHFIETPKMPFPDFGAMLKNATYSILFDENVLPYNENKFLPMQTSLQTFSQKNNFEASLKVTQILFNSAVFRGISASGIYLELSKEKLNAVTSKTVLEVKKAFNGVILSRELVGIMEASLKNAQDNLSNIKALYKEGLVSEYDQLQVEVQVENIKPKVEELRKTLEDARNGLKIVMGLPQEQAIEVDGEILYKPVLLQSEEELIERAIANNNDLKTLTLKKRVDEEFIYLEKANYWPTLTAFGNYSYAGSSDNFNFQTYNSTTVGVNFAINLFSGNRNSKRVEQATISTIQTGEQISLFKQVLGQQVKSKLLEIKKVQSQIISLERNIKLAEKAYEISKTRYTSGKGTQLEIKNADLELSTAKINKIQSEFNYLVAKADLDDLLGEMDIKYLNSVNARVEK
jgi:outer membrane protein TolC